LVHFHFGPDLKKGQGHGTTRAKRIEIAATVKLRRKGGVWSVPSQAGTGKAYTVDLKGDEPTCSCPDHETRRLKCKHIYAVEFSIGRETRPDRTTTITKTVRVTYGQNWPAYNAAQTNEKTRMAELLRGLCDGIGASFWSFHKRSNVESTFSIIKAKFGASVRSKMPVAQMNEVLCKVICHNLCVLVQSIYELGIAPTFWAEMPIAQQKGREYDFRAKPRPTLLNRRIH